MQVLFVIEGQHNLLVPGQHLNALRQDLLQFLCFQGLLRLRFGISGWDLHPKVVRFPCVHQHVQGEYAAQCDSRYVLLVSLLCDPQFFGHFALRWMPPQQGGQL